MYSSVFRYTNTWIGHASRLSAALKWRPLRLGPRMCYCSSQQQPSTCCSQSDSWGPRESNQIEWNCFWIQVILFEIDCAIFYTNLHKWFCQFISWTNWVNFGKFMDNCWISCQVMADMKKVYDDVIIINLYSCHRNSYILYSQSTFFGNDNNRNFKKACASLCEQGLDRQSGPCIGSSNVFARTYMS